MIPSPQELIECLKSATQDQLAEIYEMLWNAWLAKSLGGSSPGYSPPPPYPPPQPQPAPYTPPYPWPASPQFPWYVEPTPPQYLPPWPITSSAVPFGGTRHQ